MADTITTLRELLAFCQEMQDMERTAKMHQKLSGIRRILAKQERTWRERAAAVEVAIEAVQHMQALEQYFPRQDNG